MERDKEWEGKDEHKQFFLQSWLPTGDKTVEKNVGT